MEIYVTQPGDTLSLLAERFGEPLARLAAENGLSGSARLAEGQAIVITAPTRTHTVQPGETLFSIAAQYGLTVNALFRDNPILQGETAIYPGQTLVLTGEAPKQGTLTVTGYAYPFIETSTLRRTLPYLTYMAVFSYGLDDQGDLVTVDDDRVRSLAAEYGVQTILMLSAVNPEGVFVTENLSAVLASPEKQDALLEQILAVMEQKGFAGFELDFEYVFPEDREAYAAFARRAHARMEQNGYFLLTALAPKTSADQPGLLYEAHDYALLGAASDFVLLMTYEWGYGGGPAMAVAPINKVGEVLDYALTEIPPEKIDLGVPNYGYDWTLPFVQGKSRTYSIGNAAATARAREKGAVIRFDPTAQSPFYLYAENGVEHEVWFEDARSFAAKYALAAENGLYGLGFWSIMRFYQPAWTVLNALYSIRQG